MGGNQAEGRVHVDDAPPAAKRNVPNKRARRERGQSMVEMALVLPLFLVIVMATVDFGWALRSYIVVTNAAREGARDGVVGASEADIKATVVDKSSGLLNASDVTVTNAQTEPGTELTVSVDYDYHYISPLGPLLNLLSGGAVPDPVPISSSTTMRME